MKRLLLVEDSEADEKLALRALSKSNVPSETEVVRDGAEALDYLFATGPHSGRDVTSLPALVLLDLNLPRIDGFEVLRRLRDDPRTKLVPVVVLTASNEERDRVGAYTRGANAYVRKPVAFSEFAEAMKTLSIFWLTLNELPH